MVESEPSTNVMYIVPELLVKKYVRVDLCPVTNYGSFDKTIFRGMENLMMINHAAQPQEVTMKNKVLRLVYLGNLSKVKRSE
jgi:hypothetical protein